MEIFGVGIERREADTGDSERIAFAQTGAMPGASTVMRRTPPRSVRLTRVPVCSMMPVNMEFILSGQDQGSGVRGLGTGSASAFVRVFWKCELCAGVAQVAGGAKVCVFADAELGGNHFTIAGEGEGVDGPEGEDVLLALDVLGSDLDGVKQDTGAAGSTLRN